jgi:hypothetical protein
MGVVFRGFDPVIGRAVAIKIVRMDQFATADEKAELRLRFVREATAAGKLSHPNIVTVYHLGEQSDLQYLVLELVEGWSLEKALSNGIPQDRRATVAILSQVAAALDYAHGEGIVHRDVKPANILVRPDGKVKLTDFGIARISSQTITHTGSSMGTPAYMAPEQMVSGRVDGRADQFSLAVVAYQMLCGRRPFVAESDPALMFKIASEDAPPLHEVNRAFAPRTSEVLRRGLAKRPEQRFATCEEFIGRLSESLDEPTTAAREATTRPSADQGISWRPGRTIALVLGVGALAAAILLVGLPAFYKRPHDPAKTADLPAAKRASEPSKPPAEVPARVPADVPSGFTQPSAPAPVPPAPLVAQFTAEPASILRGQPSTLRWQVTGDVTRVSIDPAIGVVRNTGNRRVLPVESTKYTLTASGPGGNTSAGVTVSLTQPSPAAPPTRVPACDSPGSKTGSAGRHAGDFKTNSCDGLKYMWIPQGTFTMGCSPGDTECFDDEKPTRDVTVSKGFWLGQTDVTQDAYRRVMGSNPNINHFKGDNLPVDDVTWDEARNYCQAIGGRLPTEAEWEYAARAGSPGARYGKLDDIAWYYGNSGGKSHEVGQKQANAFGLYDMLGNVWQWMADWYDAGHTMRALRGGSWLNFPRNARASLRNGVVPEVRLNNFGFRCAGE